jgi:hypothetical protein
MVPVPTAVLSADALDAECAGVEWEKEVRNGALLLARGVLQIASSVLLLDELHHEWQAREEDIASADTTQWPPQQPAQLLRRHALRRHALRDTLLSRLIRLCLRLLFLLRSLLHLLHEARDLLLHRGQLAGLLLSQIRVLRNEERIELEEGRRGCERGGGERGRGRGRGRDSNSSWTGRWGRRGRRRSG